MSLAIYAMGPAGGAGRLQHEYIPVFVLQRLGCRGERLASDGKLEPKSHKGFRAQASLQIVL